MNTCTNQIYTDTCTLSPYDPIFMHIHVHKHTGPCSAPCGSCFSLGWAQGPDPLEVSAGLFPQCSPGSAASCPSHLHPLGHGPLAQALQQELPGCVAAGPQETQAQRCLHGCCPQWLLDQQLQHRYQLLFIPDWRPLRKTAGRQYVFSWALLRWQFIAASRPFSLLPKMSLTSLDYFTHFPLVLLLAPRPYPLIFLGLHLVAGSMVLSLVLLLS